jgi:hypothetical protein
MSVRSVSVFVPESNIFTVDKIAAPVRDTNLCAQFQNKTSKERSNFATTGMTFENLKGNLTISSLKYQLDTITGAYPTNVTFSEEGIVTTMICECITSKQ